MPSSLMALNLNGYELQNARVQNLAVAPTPAAVGRIYFDTTLDRFRIMTAGGWQTIGEGATTLDGQSGAFYLARVNHTGTQTLGTITGHDKAAHDSLNINAESVNGATAASLRDRSTHTGTQVASTISNFDTQVRTSRLDQMAAPTADVAFNGRKITGLADGTATTDAATFGQISAILQGQEWKAPVRVATTANITLSGTQTIDGVAVAVGDRVLVKNQTTASANGVYVVASGAWTRATDMDISAEFTNATVLARAGTVHAGDVFTQTAGAPTVGTTNIVWVQSGEGNTVYGADGSTLALVGTTFSIADGGVDLAGLKVTGTLPANRGGTGLGTYAIGDLIQAGTASSLARLAAVATGNVLLSGGVGAASAWGKVGLTTHVTGTLPLANGGTNATTAAAARTNLGAVGKFAQDIGNGVATSFVVTHNLNTRDVSVTVYLNSGTFEEVLTDVEMTSVNTVTLRFGAPPTASQYRVVVIG